MEYKIERISEIENLIEFEENYGTIIDYSEGFFLATKYYNKKDVEELKTFFNISDEQAHLVLEDNGYISDAPMYFYVDPISKKKLGPYKNGKLFSCGLASVNDGKDVIDYDGNVVLNVDELSNKHTSCLIKSISTFKNDVARASIYYSNESTEYNCYMNKKGDFIHDGRHYDRASLFSDDVTIVYKDCKQYITDIEGNLSENPLIQSIGAWCIRFSEGLCSVCDNDYKKFGFIDKDFNVIIPMEYDEVEEFSCGLCAVRKGDKWGYIDKQGNVKIPFIFDKASSFKTGVAVVNKKVRNGRLESALINTEGKIILDYSGNDIDVYNGVVVLNNLEYVPIEDMKISHGVRIRKGYGFEDKSFDSLEEREIYFELASKEIKDSNKDYIAKTSVIKKEIYSDLDKKLNELENSSLVKKHAQ